MSVFRVFCFFFHGANKWETWEKRPVWIFRCPVCEINKNTKIINMPGLIAVSEFVEETREDYNSPTTSTFVSRMPQCRQTIAALEEVRTLLIKFTKFLFTSNISVPYVFFPDWIRDRRCENTLSKLEPILTILTSRFSRLCLFLQRMGDSVQKSQISEQKTDERSWQFFSSIFGVFRGSWIFHGIFESIFWRE